MKKLKKVSPRFVSKAFCFHAAMEDAKRKGHVEYGVAFAIDKMYGGGVHGNAVLFLEDHHTKNDVQVAAARVTALHFFDNLLVLDSRDVVAMAA
jgi:hypothetical protein